MTAVISDFHDGPDLDDRGLDNPRSTSTSTSTSPEPEPADRAPTASTTPPAAAVPFTTVLAVTGMTRRQLDFWCRRGYVEAVPGRRGSGRPRVFTGDEYAVICHAYDLTAVGVAPQEAVALARKLLADDAPVVLEQDHTSVVVIRRARPVVKPSKNRRPAAAPDAVASDAGLSASTRTAAPPIRPTQSIAAIAAAVAALVAAALCTCHHPRRIHEPEGFCRLVECGCPVYERAVPGPPAFLPEPVVGPQGLTRRTD